MGDDQAKTPPEGGPHPEPPPPPKDPEDPSAG